MVRGGGTPPEGRLGAGYVSACPAAPPPPSRGVLWVASGSREARPPRLWEERGCERTLPVGGPRRRPRPLAADRRDPSRDARGQGWAELGARSFGREAGKFTARACKRLAGGEGHPRHPLGPAPHGWSHLPPPRASPPRGASPPGRVRRAPRLPRPSSGASPGASGERLPASAGARGQGRRETSPTCRRASPRPPLRAGCACARGRGCVCARGCARRAGGVRRASPAVSGRDAAARSCRRLTGGRWPRARRAASPGPEPLLPHERQPPREPERERSPRPARRC